jgi:RHS repeat-associated protein
VAGYAYDNGGTRIAALRAKTFVGVELEETLYVDPSFEIRNGEYTTYIHDAKGRLARMIPQDEDPVSKITWLHADHLGSTSLVTSNAGAFVEETKYLPYGAVQSTHRPDDGLPYEPYGFTGKEAEPDFGILYFGARYYNSHLARWLSPDPLFLHVTSESAEKDQNLYCYVDNKPILFTDKYGFVKDGDAQVRTEKAIAKSRGYTYDEYQRRKYNQSIKALPYIGAAVGATVLLVYTTYVVVPKIVLFAAPLLQQTAQRCQPVLDKTNKVVSPANRPAVTQQVRNTVETIDQLASNPSVQQVVERFGENDLILGLNPNGALKQWAQKLGGKTFAEFETIGKNFVTQIRQAMQKATTIRFNLNGVDVTKANGLINEYGEPLRNNYTNFELFIIKNTPEFLNKTRFYIDNKEVPSPFK